MDRQKLKTICIIIGLLFTLASFIVVPKERQKRSARIPARVDYVLLSADSYQYTVRPPKALQTYFKNVEGRELKPVKKKGLYSRIRYDLILIHLGIMYSCLGLLYMIGIKIIK